MFRQEIVSLCCLSLIGASAGVYAGPVSALVSSELGKDFGE